MICVRLASGITVVTGDIVYTCVIEHTVPCASLTHEAFLFGVCSWFTFITGGAGKVRFGVRFTIAAICAVLIAYGSGSTWLTFSAVSGAAGARSA